MLKIITGSLPSNILFLCIPLSFVLVSNDESRLITLAVLPRKIKIPPQNWLQPHRAGLQPLGPLLNSSPELYMELGAEEDNNCQLPPPKLGYEGDEEMTAIVHFLQHCPQLRHHWEASFARRAFCRDGRWMLILKIILLSSSGWVWRKHVAWKLS